MTARSKLKLPAEVVDQRLMFSLRRRTAMLLAVLWIAASEAGGQSRDVSTYTPDSLAHKIEAILKRGQVSMQYDGERDRAVRVRSNTTIYEEVETRRRGVVSVSSAAGGAIGGRIGKLAGRAAGAAVGIGVKGAVAIGKQPFRRR